MHDPATPAPPVLSLEHLLSRSIASQRFLMSLLALFAGLAVVLSAIGLYGVISYMVSQRTREIGIRIALGASSPAVVAMVMRKGLLLSAAGLAIGVVLSTWGTQVLRSSLFGVSPTDPLSFALGSAVLLALAVAACIGPTMQAVRIDPVTAMRSE